MSKYSTEFGLWFANIREKSGYASQRELGDATGLSNTTIHRIELGYIPKADTLRKLSEKLRATTYNELLIRAGIFEGDDSDLPDVDPEWVELFEKVKAKGSEMEATALLRSATKLSKGQLRDILKILEHIEANEPDDKD